MTEKNPPNPNLRSVIFACLMLCGCDVSTQTSEQNGDHLNGIERKSAPQDTDISPKIIENPAPSPSPSPDGIQTQETVRSAQMAISVPEGFADTVDQMSMCFVNNHFVCNSEEVKMVLDAF